MKGWREYRSLNDLAETASTARVLNLAGRHEKLRLAVPPDRVLFKSPVLSRALLLKHKVRAHERHYFADAPHVTTKVMIPIDPDDLGCGAFSFFIDQIGYDQIILRELLLNRCADGGAHDQIALNVLSELPSLDPFLVREALKRRGLLISDEYFHLSPADAHRMKGFVELSLLPLVTLCFGEGAGSRQSRRFAEKILASELDASMDPLRETLRMTTDQFAEGVFCWKGFLYYKWLLDNVTREATAIANTLSGLRTRGPSSIEERSYLEAARARVRNGIVNACREVAVALAAYDRAFAKLTTTADPITFREFLLGAPRLFSSIGEKLGVVQHITTFWSFRVEGGEGSMTTSEWIDLFSDFDSNLASVSHTPCEWAA